MSKRQHVLDDAVDVDRLLIATPILEAIPYGCDEIADASAVTLDIGERCPHFAQTLVVIFRRAGSGGCQQARACVGVRDDGRERLADLSDYFGLSHAEGRLAVELMSGKQLRAISADFGIAISTLRSQLRSALRKIGVDRQAELLRLLASVPSFPTGDSGSE